MTIKKYAVPAGVTSITLPDGSVLIPVGNVVASDSRYESELVRSGCVSDDSLYLLGVPRTVFQTAVPFVLLPGDGGTNGLTFTGGGGGAFTLSAAPLTGLFSGLSGSGSYVYLPSNAGGSGCAAGWYYCIFSSDTAGTIYNDQYTGGRPQIVGSPTTFAGSPSGRITQTISEITALSGINMTPVGANGSLEWKLFGNGDTVSGNKYYRLRLGGSIVAQSIDGASPVAERLMTVRNRGVQTAQISSRASAGVGSPQASVSQQFFSVDLSGASTAIAVTMQLTTNTGCMALLTNEFTQKYMS